jgi:hypothetical protein
MELPPDSTRRVHIATPRHLLDTHFEPAEPGAPGRGMTRAVVGSTHCRHDNTETSVRHSARLARRSHFGNSRSLEMDALDRRGAGCSCLFALHPEYTCSDASVPFAGHLSTEVGRRQCADPAVTRACPRADAHEEARMTVIWPPDLINCDNRSRHVAGRRRHDLRDAQPRR